MIRKSPIARTGILRVTSFNAEPKPARGPRAKKCSSKACRKPFVPARPFITWCCDDCGAVVALELLAKKKAKDARAERAANKRKIAEHKKQLEAHKPLPYWLAIAERHCNAYIRARDPNICISCGVTYSSAWQAGHYIAVGANSTLRFHEDNIHKQCIQCNMFKGSNAIPYREGLLAKIGLERLEWLEGWHPAVKMTAEAAQEIAEHFRKKLRELKP